MFLKMTEDIPVRRVGAICAATFAFQHVFRVTWMLVLLACLRIAVGSLQIYDHSACVAVIAVKSEVR